MSELSSFCSSFDEFLRVISDALSVFLASDASERDVLRARWVIRRATWFIAELSDLSGSFGDTVALSKRTLSLFLSDIVAGEAKTKSAGI